MQLERNDIIDLFYSMVDELDNNQIEKIFKKNKAVFQNNEIQSHEDLFLFITNNLI